MVVRPVVVGKENYCMRVLGLFGCNLCLFMTFGGGQVS